MDTLSLLEALAGSLSRQSRVFARSGLSSGCDLGAQIYALAQVAEKELARDIVKGAVGPDSAAEVAAALHRAGGDDAVELMSNLSAGDLVFPGHAYRDRGHARRAAERAAGLLGYDVTWWTNIEGSWRDGRSWNPVTRFTFDGVVAGVGEEYFVILLQVGED
ncbi:hypothetical protein GCM10009654_65910 [Streptomyces hebeiensis]|uniref:Uncharacterized protein n=1 Tax=Streptomyces hebeiensis TaxID=229486 RepID=A0ABP4FVY8_9ACTN